MCQSLADTFGLDSILATEGKAPSVLNGGACIYTTTYAYSPAYYSLTHMFPYNTYVTGLANEWIEATGVATIVLSALLEYATSQAVRLHLHTYVKAYINHVYTT